MSSFIIKNHSNSKLTLNEAVVADKQQYVLQGIFAQFDIENRNGRIYTKEEYLPHLQYLRSDIQKGEPLLGELDHPEDRFEVSLQNASHQVIDLWLDESKNCVMGKIKLLDTPSGKIAKALVDDGIPLHISSRAAGSVDARTHHVDIQQIFTFDLVCKPGFAAAVLNRVNESVTSKSYTESTTDFLKQSLVNDSKNQAQLFGILNENVAIHETFSAIKLRPEAKNIDINNKINIENMTHKLYEDESAKPLEASENAAAEMGIEQPDMSLESADDNSSNLNDTLDNENNDKKILKIEAVYKEEQEKKILSIKPIFKEDDDKDDKKPEDAEKEDDNTDAELETNESDDKEEIEKTSSNTLNDELDEKKRQLEESKKKLSKVDDLLNNLKKKKDVKESQLAQYPFAKEMSESAYKQFDNLNYEQKDKVANYIVENMIVGADNINRLWENALIDNTTEEPIWLQRASEEYRDLYERCSATEKENLANCAKYLIFESQYDVDEFWRNSKLSEKSEQQKLYERQQNLMPNITLNESNNELPYSTEFINEIEKQTLAVGKN